MDDIATPPGVDLDLGSVPMSSAFTDVAVPVTIAVTTLGLLVSMASVVVRYRRGPGSRPRQDALAAVGGGGHGRRARPLVLQPAHDRARRDDLRHRLAAGGGHDRGHRPAHSGSSAAAARRDVGLHPAVHLAGRRRPGGRGGPRPRACASTLGQRQVVLIVLLLSAVLYNPLRYALWAFVRRLVLGRSRRSLRRRGPPRVRLSKPPTRRVEQLAAVAHAVAVGVRHRLRPRRGASQ